MSNVELLIDTNVARTEARLELWSAKLKEVLAKVTVNDQVPKAETQAHLDELKAKIDAAKVKLDLAKAAGHDQWASFKDDVEITWKDLEGAFKKLVH